MPTPERFRRRDDDASAQTDVQQSSGSPDQQADPWTNWRGSWERKWWWQPNGSSSWGRDDGWAPSSAAWANSHEVPNRDFGAPPPWLNFEDTSRAHLRGSARGAATEVSDDQVGSRLSRRHRSTCHS
eukprot:274588-Pyramimonas_sp.AAC.1